MPKFARIFPVSDLDKLVPLQSDLVEVCDIKPEMKLVTEVHAEVAQLRVRNWCVVDGDLDHVQQSQPICGGRNILLLLLRQDNCPQNLFRGLMGSLRCTVGLGVEM